MPKDYLGNFLCVDDVVIFVLFESHQLFKGTIKKLSRRTALIEYYSTQEEGNKVVTVNFCKLLKCIDNVVENRAVPVLDYSDLEGRN